MKELSKRLGDMEYDGLVTNIIPQTQVNGGVIEKGDEKTTLKRGTVLAKSAKNGTLEILGTSAATGDTLTADCILCDDIEIGTDEDVNATVYTAGCFDPDKLIVADGYTLTEGDKDKLRERGIVLKAAAPAQ